MKFPTRRKNRPKTSSKRCGNCDGYGVTEIDGTERCEFGPAYVKCSSCKGTGWRAQPEKENK